MSILEKVNRLPIIITLSVFLLATLFQPLEAGAKIYTNDKYGFTVEYSDVLRLVEFEPKSGDTFLIRTFISDMSGEFATRLAVYKNDAPVGTHKQVHEIINKWYGRPEGTMEPPFPNAIMEQYRIGDQPAIKIDYLESSEDPSVISPASIVCTANEYFMYWLSCCCDRGECNRILRSFLLINIDWQKHVPKEEHFDSPSIIKLKVLHPTVTTSSGQKVTGWFVIKNIGPDYALSPKTFGPHYIIHVYDINKSPVFRGGGSWSPTMKSGQEITVQWGTTMDEDGKTEGPRFLFLDPGLYEMRVDVLIPDGQIFDTMTYSFEVKRVD